MNTPDPRVISLCLYAWVGEDEFDGTVGLKQAVVPDIHATDATDATKFDVLRAQQLVRRLHPLRRGA